MCENWRVANEVNQRTGHKFNIIIKNLPDKSDAALTFTELLKQVKANGYVGGKSELQENLSALERRKEIAVKVDQDGTKKYRATQRGRIEYRKRIALIKLHIAELSEEDINALEKMAEKSLHHKMNK